LPIPSFQELTALAGLITAALAAITKGREIYEWFRPKKKSPKRKRRPRKKPPPKDGPVDKLP
jgi:hypothetical protein